MQIPSTMPGALSSLSRGHLLRSGSPEQQSKSREILQEYPRDSVSDLMDRLGEQTRELFFQGSTLSAMGLGGVATAFLGPGGSLISMLLGATVTACTSGIGAFCLFHALRNVSRLRHLKSHSEEACKSTLESGPQPGTLRDWRFRDEGFLSHVHEVRRKDSDEVVQRSARVGEVLIQEEVATKSLLITQKDGTTRELAGQLQLPRLQEEHLVLRSGQASQSFDIHGNSWFEAPAQGWFRPRFWLTPASSDGPHHQTWADGSVCSQGWVGRPLLSATQLGLKVETEAVGTLPLPLVKPYGAEMPVSLRAPILDVEAALPAVGEMTPVQSSQIVGERLRVGKLELRQMPGSLTLVHGDERITLAGQLDPQENALRYRQGDRECKQDLSRPGVCSVRMTTPEGIIEVVEEPGAAPQAQLLWGDERRSDLPVEIEGQGYLARLSQQSYHLVPPVGREYFLG